MPKMEDPSGIHQVKASVPEADRVIQDSDPDGIKVFSAREDNVFVAHQQPILKELMAGFVKEATNSVRMQSDLSLASYGANDKIHMVNTS